MSEGAAQDCPTCGEPSCACMGCTYDIDAKWDYLEDQRDG